MTGPDFWVSGLPGLSLPGMTRSPRVIAKPSFLRSMRRPGSKCDHSTKQVCDYPGAVIFAVNLVDGRVSACGAACNRTPRSTPAYFFTYYGALVHGPEGGNIEAGGTSAVLWGEDGLSLDGWP